MSSSQNGQQNRTGAKSLDIGAVCRFVETRIPHCRPFNGQIVALPLFRDGVMAGAVIFHNWDAQARNIEVAIAADTPRWLSRQRLERVFQVAFDEDYIGARRITCRIDASNPRSRRLCEGLGFRLEGLLREAAYDGGDLLIYGLLKRECRYIAQTGQYMGFHVKHEAKQEFRQ